MNWKPQHPAFRALLAALLQQNVPVYIVGGVVRDFFLGTGQKLADLDLVVEHSAIPLARQVADRLGWAFYPLDELRDVARLVFTANLGEPLVCDIARQRGDSIEHDLLLRDFTINALAFAIKGPNQVDLIDICNGRADIQNRIIRRVSAASLADDPIRLLRAIRFAVQFGFSLEEQTRLQIKRVCSTVSLASAERIRDELWKMLITDEPARAIHELHQVGVLTYVLPEVAKLDGIAQSYPHHEDVYQHTLRVVQQAVQLRNWLLGKAAHRADAAAQAWQERLTPRRTQLRNHFTVALAGGRLRAEWLVLHALFHDIGKPFTRTAELQPGDHVRYRFLEHERVGAELAETRLNALRFSRQEIQLARTVIENHMRPHLLSAAFVGKVISRRACYRFYRHTHQRQAEHPMAVDTLLLALADYQGTYREMPPPNWLGYLQHIDELLAFGLDADGISAAQQSPLVDGYTLMHHFQLTPGRQVGQLLEQLLEAQAAGDIKTQEEAIELASSWLHETKSTTEA
ncbi:MAG: HD domain-containing protein [Caldilineaceae bacterium]|nr:HD domain-containing protein [Caldilineaceae bacterium]